MIDVRRMTDEEIASYGDEMKAFFAFIKYSESPEDILRVIDENAAVFSNLGELTYETLTELTNSPELRKLQGKYRTTEGGMNVCAGIKGLMDQSKKQGEAIGIEKGEARGIKKGEARGIKKGKAIGVKQGEAIGVQKGENKLASLILKLNELGRSDDIVKVTKNVKYRNKLYTDFGIT